MYAADITVIGAGPGGASAANTIAKAGYNVLLVEKDEYPGKNNVCGGGITEQFFNNLKLPDEIIEKRILYAQHHFPWGVYKSQQRHVTVLRKDFDRYLAAIAVEKGAKLLTSTKVSDVKRKGEKMVIYANRNHKNMSSRSCNLVIFADGVNTLAKKFGIGFGKNKNNTALGLIYAFEWKDNPIDYYEVFHDTSISRWGYGWIYPKKDFLNVGVGCLLSKMGGNIKRNMSYFLKNPIVSAQLKDRKILSKKAALIPLAPAREIHDQAILVVGDAAGMVNPFSGGGIENTIVAGEIAGKVAIKAMEENDFSGVFLSNYKKLWEETSNYALIKRQSIMGKFFLQFSNLDTYILPKFMNLFYIKDCIHLDEKMRIALYPFFRE